MSFLTLAFSGLVILMAHPRLYWGEVGNDLTPALIELPISRNHQHGGWEKSAPFFAGRRLSHQRESDLRHLQSERLGAEPALSGGVVPGRARRVYLLAGLFAGHFRRPLAAGRRSSRRASSGGT